MLSTFFSMSVNETAPKLATQFLQPGGGCGKHVPIEQSKFLTHICLKKNTRLLFKIPEIRIKQNKILKD
jgi:hypothetical protein